MARTRPPAAKSRTSGQSRFSHKTAACAPSDAVIMLKGTPWPVSRATKLATAEAVGNGPSRLCDAPSPGAMRNDSVVAHWRSSIRADWQNWRERPVWQGPSMIIRLLLEATTLPLPDGGKPRQRWRLRPHFPGRDRLTWADVAPISRGTADLLSGAGASRLR